MIQENIDILHFNFFMKTGKKKIWMFGILLCLLSIQNIKAQSLSGTTWNVTVPAISAKPYNFIFADTGNKGNVLMPDRKLANFTWSEDGKGNWSITLEQFINGVKKIETFYGKITGSTGTGFYANTVDGKKLKPLMMTKKQ